MTSPPPADPAAALVEAARAAESRGQPAIAESLLRRAAAASGWKGPAARQLAVFLMGRGGWPAARDVVAAVAAADPDDRHVPLLRAQGLVSEGKRAEALDLLRASLALDPGSGQLRRLAVKLLKQDRRHLEAAETAAAGLAPSADLDALTDVVDIAARPPGFFLRLGEADDYTRAMERLFVGMAAFLGSLPPGRLVRAVSQRFLASANLRMVLFSDIDTSAMMRARAALVRLAEEDAAPAPADPPAARSDGRIRVGVLMTRIGPDVESEGMLPMFLPLDPARFFRGVYVLEDRDGPFAQRARAAADEYEVLPPSYADQVAALRAKDLDLLLVGNDNTCFYTPLTRLSATRVARVQATNFVSAISSFYPTMDAFFVGDAFLSGTWLERYGEAVVPLPGIGFRLEPAGQAADGRGVPGRGELGIPPDAVLFASGANIFKIIPEVVHVWAEILRRVPEGCLLLAPFNRSLADDQRDGFMAMVRGIVAAAGVSPDRVVFLPPLGSRARFRAAMALADVGLDSFPFSGGSTTVDMVEAGVPMVVLSGGLFRSKLSEAILSALGLGDWVVPTRPAYVARAAALGRDREARRAMRELLRGRLDGDQLYAGPEFVRGVEAAYERLAAGGAPPG